MAGPIIVHCRYYRVNYILLPKININKTKPLSMPITTLLYVHVYDSAGLSIHFEVDLPNLKEGGSLLVEH